MGDPYEWRESVLSTRSMSYASNMGDLTSIDSAPPAALRKNTLTSISSYGEDQDFHDAQPTVTPPTLPPSVSSSPLFLLPREIRTQIWQQLLRSDTEIVWPSERQSLGLSVQTLLLCRAIYEEAAHVLYTSNTLCFAHPSDANMFSHALSNRPYACRIPHVTLRIRSQDTRLWTGWFNTNAPERSLSHDLPSLRSLTIRYRGPRWQPALNEKANADLWLKDPKLQEIILSVRKCVATVRLLLCVRLPTEPGEGADDGDEDKLPRVMFRRWAWLNGCYIRVEAIGMDDES